MAEKKIIKKKPTTIVRVTQTDEDKILGIEPAEEVVKAVSYEDPTRKYKVTALHEGATPVIVNGGVIETFIGSTNRVARQELKEGAKSVITVDGNGKQAYKIEVIK